MLDRQPTPPQTLARARGIALDEGLRYAYTGNVFDPEGQSTYCPGCGATVIERSGYTLGTWALDEAGRCRSCGTPVAGEFEVTPGDWGSRRAPVRMAQR